MLDQVTISYPQPISYPATEILHKDVRPLHQSVENLSTRLTLHIKGDASLITVLPLEIQVSTPR
jgi:hypothetical protein